MDGPQIPEGYVAYPRESQNPIFGPAPRRVRFDALGDAWRILCADWGIWVLASLTLIGIQIVVTVPFSIYNTIRMMPQTADPSRMPAMPADAILLSIVSAFISQVAIGCVLAGIMKAGLTKVRTGYVSYTSIFSYEGNFGKLLVAQICIGVVMTVPQILMFVGMTMIGSRGDLFQASIGQIVGLSVGYLLVLVFTCGSIFVPLLALDQGMTPGEAFSESFKAALPNFFPILGLLIVAGLASALGFIACCVGILFTLPLYYLTMAVVYHDFFRPVQREMPATPPTDMMTPPTYG